MEVNMISLFKESFQAAAQYVVNRIDNVRNRKAYISAYHNVFHDLNNENIHLMADIRTLIKIRRSTLEDADFPFTLFSDPKRYHLMAYNHALDIIEKLSDRFGDA